VGKLYIVTGAKGHVGNTVIKALLASGENVRALAVPQDRTKALYGLNIPIFEGDVCDPDSLEALFQHDKNDELIVIHTAGIVSISSKQDQKVYDVNVNGTKNIISMCKKYGVKRLVYVSSVHAIPEKPAGETITEVSHFDPDLVEGYYAKTKAEATQAVLDSVKDGLDAVVVHPSGIIGPNDYGRAHMTQMMIDYLDGRLTACIEGGYDFVDVRDVADGIIAAVDKGRSGECYILSNTYTDVATLLDNLHQLSGKRRIKTVLPRWFALATAPLAELFYKLLGQPPLFTRYSLYTLYSNANFSHAKATRELGYKPRSLRLTTLDTITWLLENKRIKKRAALRLRKFCAA
jgi:dihydroflavonol-4-reductase